MASTAEEGAEKLLKLPGDEPRNEEDLVDTQKIRFVDEKKDSRRQELPGDASAKEAQKVLGQRSDVDPVEEKKRYRSYPRRWVVLASVALLNNTNAFLWIAFAAVANHVNVFYGFSQAANWFSLIFILCTIPVGIFAMWMGSRFGLRTALMIAAWLNGFGTVLRFLSSFVPLSARFPIGILGQGISASAYPFIMFLPTKVAGAWFGANERTLATTIGVMANPLGVLMANLISPQVVTKANDVPLMNGIVMVPTLVTCLLVTFGVKSSRPKTAPTAGADSEQMKFIPGLKACYSNKSYLILALTLGGGIGMFNCLYTVIQQLLCPTGYSNAFSGFCASIMIVGGIIGATCAGLFVDRTKLYEETLKVSFALAVVCGLLFLQLTLRQELDYFVIIASFFFGVFGLAAYPVGLEISAECTFPVPENLSTGIVVIAGQIQSFIFVGIINLTSRVLPVSLRSVQTCSTAESDGLSSAKDNSIPVMALSAAAATLALVLVILFRPKLKRLEAEQVNWKKTNKESEKLLDDKEIQLSTLNRASESAKDEVVMA